jgi:hypothetical protein
MNDYSSNILRTNHYRSKSNNLNFNPTSIEVPQYRSLGQLYNMLRVLNDMLKVISG